MTQTPEKPWRKHPHYRASKVFYREDWVTGPDDERHDKYYVWMRAKAQARFKNQTWDLTFEEFESFWTPERWEWRGSRTKNGLILARLDPQGPWSVDNCQIMTRRQQVRRFHGLDD